MHDEQGEKKPIDVIPPLLLTIPQAALALNLSRAKIYRLIKRGAFPVVHLDRSVRVSWASLQHWVETQEKQTTDHTQVLPPFRLQTHQPSRISGHL